MLRLSVKEILGSSKLSLSIDLIRSSIALAVFVPVSLDERKLRLLVEKLDKEACQRSGLLFRDPMARGRHYYCRDIVC